MLVLLLASLILRLVLAAILPFTVDEAYAVVVSRSHALAYFDHPFLSFSLARLMADITGSEAPFLLRLPFVLAGTASTVLLYQITRKIFGGRAGFWACAAMNISPFFLTSAGFFVVPDGPLDLFLLLSLWAIAPVLLQGDTVHVPSHWLAAGAALALALASKYQAVLFGVSAFAVLFVHKQGRSQLRGPWPWLACGIASLGLIPTLAWNARHGWVSFAFQSGRSHSESSFSKHLANVLMVVLGQMAYVLPGTWLHITSSIFRCLKSPRSHALWILATLAATPMIVFDGIAVISHKSLPHWPMYGFLLAMPLAGRWLAGREVQNPRHLHRAYLTGAIVIPSLALLFSLQARYAILTRYVCTRAPAFDINSQNINWTALAGSPASTAGFVVTPTWIQAGSIGLVLGPSVPLEILGDAHHFQFMDRDVLSQRTAGCFVGACAFGDEADTEASSLLKLQGRYQATGATQWITQTRLGFPSFKIIIIPVKRS